MKNVFMLLFVLVTVASSAQDGSSCSQAIPIVDYTTYTATFDNTWYTFTAAESGLYNVTTCNLATCDTKIWIYENCPANETLEWAEGTLIFNDDYCDYQSNVNFTANPGDIFYIRIGDYFDACSGPVDWGLNFLGQIYGCTDPTMCNYNPLATEEDGSCISFDDPLCLGPDLRFDADELVGSLQVLQHYAEDCDIQEGCVTGYGLRQVITFTSKIDNIGQQDYYIGNPFTNPQMFNTQNCHGHAHYEGYGDYKMVDMDGNVIPAGHKNGFCVMDLCGFGQYDCGDMGISAGCYDAYGAGTQCQWVDVTEIPDGDYRLIAIVNPFYLPDALGREEEDVVNNMTTVCIHVTHDDNGEASFTLLGDCPEYVDCAGTVNGNAWPDCNGDCNGSAKYGDVVANEALDEADLLGYLSMLSEYPVPVTGCNDLSGNGTMTVYDIALNQNCQNAVENEQDVLSQCNFPIDIMNSIADPCGLAIAGYDLDEGWFDVELTSTVNDVLAYQFQVSGVTLAEVVSLPDASDYQCLTGYSAAGQTVFAYSLAEDVVEHGSAPTLLCRVYFNAITASEICITAIDDIVNQDLERTMTYIYGDCITAVGLSETAGNGTGLLMQPNPAADLVKIFAAGTTAPAELVLRDATGREVLRTVLIPSTWKSLDISGLSSGLYSATLENGTTLLAKTKFVKE